MAASSAVPTQPAAVRGKHPPASRHGALEEVFPGIWFVRGGIRMPMFMPITIGRSMTVVRRPDGELVVFNSMRLTEKGLEKLEALGKVAHVVRIAGFHGRDDGFYRERYGAKVYAVEGQRYERGLGKKNVETYMEPDVWMSSSADLPLEDATLHCIESSTPAEAVCVLQRDGGILIAGDSLQHTPTADEFFSFLGKIMMKRFGFLKPHNVGPGWLQFASPKAQDVRALLDLEFDHVLPGHGRAVLSGAKEKYRPSLEGELKGCHED